MRILLVVICLVLARVVTEEISYQRFGSSVSCSCFFFKEQGGDCSLVCVECV